MDPRSAAAGEHAHHQGLDDERSASGPIRRVKIAIPPPPVGSIPRPRLHALLDAAVLHPVTEVTAGAGYGKTTLLAAWARGRADDDLIAWLSLDGGDRDLRRFAAHLAAAIRQAVPGALPDFDLLLDGNRPLDPDAIADLIADALLDLPAPLVLILDDVHLLAGTPPARLIGAFLRFPMSTLRIVLGSRVAPDLPAIDALRWRAQAAAIDAGDLRVTAAECAAILSDDVAIPAEEVLRRTEGWVAGIQALGAAQAAGARQLPERLRSFLRSDLLAGQPDDLIEFLSGIAPVERTCSALGAAMTLLPGGEAAAAAMLADAERRGLFVTRLDDAGVWWRMHPLLRDALLADLPESRQQIANRRASEWFAAAGMVEEAVHHAFRSDDLDRAAALLADHAGRWLERSIFQPTDWMDRLPDDLLDQHPAMLVARARDLLGRSSPATGPAVARANAAIGWKDPQGADPQFDSLRAELIAIRAMLANMTGDPRTLRGDIERVLLDPQTSPRLRHDLLLAFPFMFILDQRTGEGRAMLAGLEAERGPDTSSLSTGIHLAAAMFDMGELDLWGARRKATLAAASPGPAYQMRTATWARIILARAHYEANDLDAAIDLARESILDPARVLVLPRHANTQTLVRGLLAQGRVDEARAAVAADRRRLELAGATMLAGEDDALDALVDLAAGDLPRAARWADVTEIGIAPGQIVLDDRIPVIQSRIWLARNGPGDAERALSALTLVREYERDRHMPYTLVRMLPHFAVAHARAGNPAMALSVMEDALALGPGQAVRHFADAGAIALGLLGSLARSRRRASADRASAVLAALGIDESDAPAAPAPPSKSTLTHREAQVLDGMAASMTNKEIARELGISTTTVRDYGVQIFQKLGVGDRRHAVEVARAAGWLRDERPVTQ
jgi:LuxR family maltose regulon positive regulatory protein